MNILVKNADFSQVSIGKIEMVLTPVSVISHAYMMSTGNISYLATPLSYCIVYDITSLENGATVEVTGRLGYEKTICAFYDNPAPTTDSDFASQTDANNYMSVIGTGDTTGCVFSDDATGNAVKTISVPSGAKCLIVNIGINDVDYCKVKVVL